MALSILQQAPAILRRPEIIDDNFPKQAAFIRSKAKRKAALCTRRAGKSYGIGLYLCEEALKTPRCTVLYLALTRDSARNIMWKDVLKDINYKHGLGAKVNETLLTMTLPNGSEIKLAGADATKEEMEKYLGGKYALIVIDEAGSFRQDMEKLVYENLEPAVADYDGTIVMIGTPTALTKSLFYDVTRPDVSRREKGWDVHHWTTFDNPYMKDKWDERMRRMLETKPEIVETPGYKRMYLGQWVTDLDDLCYKFDPYKNTCQTLPDAKNYTYILGVDLGYSPDPSAFVVCAYSRYDKTLYFVEAYKKTEMIISAVADRIRYYQKRFDIHTIVIDNAAKQSVEELKQRFSLPLIAADKTGKADFIEIMNSELILSRIKVLPDAAELPEEWESLIWDEKAAKRTEHPACDNHLADAALYAWRYAYSYLAEAAPEKRTDEEIVEEWFERDTEERSSRNYKPFWERDFA